MAHQPKILVCPLDWGIGHATRMVPVIHALIRQGADVHIGASGRSLAFLQGEFPGLHTFEFPGYEIRYPSNGAGMALKMIQHGPFLLRSIQEEHSKLDQLVREFGFSGIISDNRYGLHSEKVPCIFITHQVFMQTPWHLGFLKPIIHSIIKRYISRFKACWIPDVAGEQNLSGELSHKSRLPGNYQFIGPLSRFNNLNGPAQENHTGSYAYDILVILSGPEPQRTILENQILGEIGTLGINAAMVCGKPGSKDLPESPENCTVFNHLGSQDLLEMIKNSKLVISRSGYSTIMDLATLGKKAVLVPTPGQTEQEYLAKYLQQKGYYLTFKQAKLSLNKAIEQAENYPGLNLSSDHSQLDKRVNDFLLMT